ncbi:Hydroxymethylpyrimidine/phosphomethylpyrimidine kinase [Flavobacterium sp. 9AF]|uniref:hydroxymethylpyrimidine/phosphomethylpyrimidine kinase n=1 Tax=Flavobacterium sp. 9AF TaxID=2653142 RepID=UPI0012F34E3A|nr:hydroxymethylpyrimidine/phosphomethylpyrimidine kinase [Flavobacterium sp. 9AF]VXB19342.1 Hydroxymethylpyrimidine/phosphomethylpyrimidine kinase [Flavobacterium sp. 9AF]
MSKNCPYLLTIAGFDPSGGAGVLADIKTLELLQVYGLSVLTANTIQTESTFIKTTWIPLDFVLESIRLLLETYPVSVIKIGIVPSLDYLEAVVLSCKKWVPEVKIVWDTVLRSSTAFDFLKIENQKQLHHILKQVDIITPNYQEIVKLIPFGCSIENGTFTLSAYCAVLLKGGHNKENTGTDDLFIANKKISIPPTHKVFYEKHGTGCVLATAIAAHLALGEDLYFSCKKAKLYIENYLNSNPTLLGYHYA